MTDPARGDRWEAVSGLSGPPMGHL